MNVKYLPTGEALQTRAKELGVILAGEQCVNIPGTGTVPLAVSEYELQRRVIEARAPSPGTSPLDACGNFGSGVRNKCRWCVASRYREVARYWAPAQQSGEGFAYRLRAAYFRAIDPDSTNSVDKS